jgi:hypothetical protein
MSAPSLLDEMMAQLEATASPEVTEADLQRIRDLDLSSCDFCESGCSDPDCWRCYSPLRPDNLRRLAKNLAVAAMLCRAWDQRDVDPAWRPGCNLVR